MKIRLLKSSFNGVYFGKRNEVIEVSGATSNVLIKFGVAVAYSEPKRVKTIKKAKVKLEDKKLKVDIEQKDEPTNSR